MKTLKQLNNVEKAQLLFHLFPDEIPSYMETMQGICNAIRKNEAEHRVRHAETILKKYGINLRKAQHCFPTSYLTISANSPPYCP